MSELYELYLNKAATKITGYHAKQTKEARHILAILIRQMETKASSIWISVIDMDWSMLIRGWKLGWIRLIVSGTFYIPLR